MNYIELITKYKLSLHIPNRIEYLIENVHTTNVFSLHCNIFYA